MASWNFFTNYGHIIFVISKNPSITNRELSQIVGITERATQKIIHDLESEGFIKIKKVGRNNEYSILKKKKLRHEIEKQCSLGDLINLININ